jgi:5-methylcytosine-specific restriction endonuclease McrA
MPYKNPKRDRNYKKEYANQLAGGSVVHERRMERQRARRAMDAEGIDRAGKDIDHKTPLSKGGKNTKGNLRLVSPSTNRSFDRNADHSLKKNAPPKKAKK